MDTPSRWRGSPLSSRTGILRVWSHRVPAGVWIGSSGISSSVRRWSTSRSLATKNSAWSLGKKSWSLLPMSSSRLSPSSSSPARLKRWNRNVSASFTNTMAGSCSRIESRNRFRRRVSASACLSALRFSTTSATPRSSTGIAHTENALCSAGDSPYRTWPTSRGVRCRQMSAYSRTRSAGTEGKASDMRRPTREPRSAGSRAPDARFAYSSRNEPSSAGSSRYHTRTPNGTCSSS